MKLLILCLSTACAPTMDHVHVVSVDPTFQRYFVNFEEDSLLTGHFQNIDDLIIQFNSDLSEEQAGECVFGSATQTPTINISTAWWPTFTDDQKEVLIFHELGHCVLHRGHKTTLYKDEPDSVMWPSVLLPGLYTWYHDHYVNELFTGEP